MKKAWIFIFFHLVAPPVLAIVDMKNANYSHTWVDIIVPGNGRELKVDRSYNSRSLFKGIFGFGWCSDFETKLIPLQDGTIKIVECGDGQETIFTKKNYSIDDVELSIARITDRANIIFGYSTDKINNLKKKLRLDHDYIIEMMRNLGIADVFHEGDIYFNEDTSILINRDYYEQRFINDSYRRFDKSGHLIFNKIDKDNYLNLHYESGLLAAVDDNIGRRLVFHYNNNNKITSINSSPNGFNAEYKFYGDDLVFAKNTWGKVYTYKYDDLHNLTKVNWPDKSYIELVYDRDKDWVTSFRDRAGCIENYDYQFSIDDPQNHYWTLVKKTCSGEVVADNKYEFFYKANHLGRMFLYKVATSVNGKVDELVYDELSGRPLHISRNDRDEEIFFDYYQNGLLKTKSGKSHKYALTYDVKFNKIRKLQSIRLDEKGKTVSEKISMFRWSAKGLLESIETTSGYKSNIIHDSHDRILSIQDQNKTLLKIEYEDRFGKPSRIALIGLGFIHVTYTPEGDIDKVEAVNNNRQLATEIKNFITTLLKEAITVDDYSNTGDDIITQKEISAQVNPIMVPIDKIMSIDSGELPGNSYESCCSLLRIKPHLE